MQIKAGDFDNPKVQDLVRLHRSGMRDHTPECGVHALDFSALQSADITFLTVWDDDALLGMGALKALSPSQGEIKSMRTDPAHTRKGVGAILLDYILELARQRGYAGISLETGTGPAFEAALTLYRKYGFEKGKRFGDYLSTDFNQFFHLDLR